MELHNIITILINLQGAHFKVISSLFLFNLNDSVIKVFIGSRILYSEIEELTSDAFCFMQNLTLINKIIFCD